MFRSFTFFFFSPPVDLGQEEVLDVITQDLVLVQGLTEGLEAARIAEITEDVTATVALPCQIEGDI